MTYQGRRKPICHWFETDDTKGIREKLQVYNVGKVTRHDPYFLFSYLNKNMLSVEWLLRTVC